MRIPCGTEPRSPSQGRGAVYCADQYVSSWRRSNALHAFTPRRAQHLSHARRCRMDTRPAPVVQVKGGAQ